MRLNEIDAQARSFGDEGSQDSRLSGRFLQKSAFDSKFSGHFLTLCHLWSIQLGSANVSLLATLGSAFLPGCPGLGVCVVTLRHWSSWQCTNCQDRLGAPPGIAAQSMYCADSDGLSARQSDHMLTGASVDTKPCALNAPFKELSLRASLCAQSLVSSGPTCRRLVLRTRPRCRSTLFL